MKEFEEDEVIKYIREALPADAADKYSDDDLLNIVDMIWDYYEMNGLIDIDNDDDEQMSESELRGELVDYAARMLRKDKYCKVEPEHLEAIISGELAYEDFLDQEMFK